MDCNEMIVDMRGFSPEDKEKGRRITELQFKLSHTMPMTDEYQAVLKELFGENIGTGSYVAAPLNGAALDKMKIGNNVFINANMLAMARGGITIEDDVQIAGNVSLLTNNHDPYDRMILPCKPILIKKGAWIGANVVILRGISVGKHAIVGAGSVVTKDVPDYAVVVGNPAKVVKMLDPEKFD
ncbi:acyltransferase [Ruminococcus flavefaciens]|uniref:acyltransferase n=1 Tax=Ruminococcus flavefaciens TaxID=1265 RepID=UPI0005623C88|nr:acyltransferase [Ruminococcus flavefaciens]